MDLQIEHLTGDAINRNSGNGSEVFDVDENHFLVVKASEHGNTTQNELHVSNWCLGFEKCKFTVHREGFDVLMQF